ncbi:MAG: universal stress protein [Thermoleophilia bacterium]|nr:universal stress protein [Thermoleophilia bacterium]
MIKSILVALDGSAHAAAARDHAVELARLYQAKVIGLHVLDVRLLEMPPYLEYSYEGIPLTPLPSEMLEGFRQKADKVLVGFREAMNATGVPTDARLEEGVPAETIAELGDAADLVVMGKRGEHARWGRDLLGATTEGVVRRIKTPVLLTERDAVPLAEVVLLYDGSHPANRALKLAADLVSHAGLGLRVMTAADDLDHAGKVQRDARDYLDAFDFAVEYRLRTGDAVLAVLQELEDDPAGLVVMGSQGRSLLRRLVLGSTAEELMRSIDVPVLLAP